MPLGEEHQEAELPSKKVSNFSATQDHAPLSDC